MKPPTFTIIKASGVLPPDMYAGGSLEPSANGANVTVSPGAISVQDVKRPALRLVVSD